LANTNEKLNTSISAKTAFRSIRYLLKIEIDVLIAKFLSGGRIPCSFAEKKIVHPRFC